jgi:putative transposase
MARKPLIRTEQFPYHVVARSNNRDWFSPGLDAMWNLFSLHLRKISDAYGVEVHAFVLMSNHFHLLLTTPNKNIDQAMNYLMREMTKSGNRIAGRINHLFGGPYKWTVIHNSWQYAHTLKYLYLNPVKAGICDRVEDYKYSSLHASLPGTSYSGLLLQQADMPVHPLLGSDISDALAWFNAGYSAEESDCLRRALRRKEFKLSPDRVTRRLPKTFTQSDAVPL